MTNVLCSSKNLVVLQKNSGNLRNSIASRKENRKELSRKCSLSKMILLKHVTKVLYTKWCFLYYVHEFSHSTIKKGIIFEFFKTFLVLADRLSFVSTLVCLNGRQKIEATYMCQFWSSARVNIICLCLQCADKSTFY